MAGGDDKNPDNGSKDKIDEMMKKLKGGKGKFPIIYLVGVIVAIIAINSYFTKITTNTIPLSDFKYKVSIGEIKYVKLVDGMYEGFITDPKTADMTRLNSYKSVPLQD